MYQKLSKNRFIFPENHWQENMNILKRTYWSLTCQHLSFYQHRYYNEPGNYQQANLFSNEVLEGRKTIRSCLDKSQLLKINETRATRTFSSSLTS